MSDTAPQWDVSAMKSAYCSLAKATATQDAVVVNLGVAGGGAGNELRPQLLHRVHLTPAAAKRLHEILGRLLGEYAAGR
jgi:hypothetical protein